MNSCLRSLSLGFLLVCAFASGCASPYRADQGALYGGLGGAGVGALVGHATGNTAAGAAIGAGVGAISGAAIGGSLDEIEAKNRAMIEAQMQRPVGPNPVTIDDVVAMTRAGVSEELIANHVRSHGVARPLQATDLILLQQEGVSPGVVRVMQEPPMVQSQPAPVIVQPAPRPVIVEEYHYGPPVLVPYGPPMYHHHCHPRPRVGVGVAFHN